MTDIKFETAPDGTRIAYRLDGKADLGRCGFFWLGGYKSDMEGAKAEALAGLAREHRMPLQVQEDVQVARRRAARTRLAAARQAQLGPVVDARRNLERDGLRRLDTPLAAAFRTGIGDHRPCAVAAWARALEHERPLLRPHLARTVA